MQEANMWSRLCLSSHLRRGVSSIASINRNDNIVPYGMRFGGIVDFGHCGTPAPTLSVLSVLKRTFSVSPPSESSADAVYPSGLPPRSSCAEGDPLTVAEAKRLMRLVNVEGLKTKLGVEGKEIIGYKELLEACQIMGVARTLDEANTFAQVLDEAGVVLLFRDKVYLHPDKVVDLVRKAMPIALTPEDDPTRDELKQLQEKKEEIDVLAHKQVRRILWTGLGLSIIQVSLFFRLTFWEFSWDVMEPIAFFTTATGIVIGYAYFLFTSRDPTYQDLMKRLFLRSQRKLFIKHKFDVPRFVELQKKCRSPMDARASIKNRVGMELDLEDALHRN